MVYFVNDNGTAKTFWDMESLKAAGYDKADGETTEENYNANGCYVRIINGKPVVGKTKKEKADEAKQENIAKYKAELAELDRQAGAGRFIRDVSLAYAKKNGMASGKGYENLVAIETRADEIREELAPLLGTDQD